MSPNDAWRSLGWPQAGQTAIERWKARAAAVGLSPADAGRLWNDVLADQVAYPWPFSALREADRRLTLHCAQRERPVERLREAAMGILAYSGMPFGPADVDAGAEALARLEAA